METFSCESCDVNFSEPESLKKHMALHEVFGIKVGQCEIQSVGATTASKPKENENEHLKNQHNIAPGPADSKLKIILLVEISLTTKMKSLYLVKYVICFLALLPHYKCIRKLFMKDKN